MISKLRFSLIAVILLVLLGFGFQNQANGQVGENGQFCPFVEVPDGWLEVSDITPLSDLDFTAGLIGTVEGVNGGVFGGMDWMHVDFTSFNQPTPTNEDGSQIVTWWTQKNGRNTYVQLTNDLPDGTWVHARLLNENCVEIRDFCDFYTGGDTHVYDFGDLITNEGETPGDAGLQGHEGFLTITAVDDCPSPDQAIEHNALAATVQIISDIDEYGFNAYHRYGVCFDEEIFFDVNLVLNGSFQEGSLFPWQQQQGGASGVIQSTGIQPPVAVPPCQGPDCDDTDANLFMSYILSDATVPTGYYGQNSPGGSFASQLSIALGVPTAQNLIGVGPVDTNVTIVQSNVFTPFSTPGAVSNTNTVQYDLALLAPEDVIFSACQNYAAVCVIDITPTLQIVPGPPVVEDCNCYQQNTTANVGNILGFGACQILGNDNLTYAIGAFEFQGGTGPFVSDTLSAAANGSSYVVQYITAQKDGLCETNPLNITRATTGALVDNFRNIDTVLDLIECNGILTGEFNAFLSQHLPEVLAGQFNTIVDDAAAADAVIINFADEYLPEYRTLAAFVSSEIGIFDEFEDFQSCGDAEYCFVRLGIDTDLPVSEEFNTPTPIVSPTTPPPSTTPPTTGPTPSPSNNGGGGSCAIAGNPVQLGTAFANVLIPLVPVAFAFGVRAVRRRKK